MSLADSICSKDRQKSISTSDSHILTWILPTFPTQNLIIKQQLIASNQEIYRKPKHVRTCFHKRIRMDPPKEAPIQLSFEKMPAEITKNIATRLPRNDLYALRRTGKGINNGCQDEFIHTLKEVSIYPHQLVSLKYLHDIAAVPVYAAAVESLRLIIAHFAGNTDERREYLPDKDPTHLIDDLECPDGPSTGIDDRMYGSKQTVARKEENYRLLVEVLPKLPNLRKMICGWISNPVIHVFKEGNRFVALESKVSRKLIPRRGVLAHRDTGIGLTLIGVVGLRGSIHAAKH